MAGIVSGQFIFRNYILTLDSAFHYLVFDTHIPPFPADCRIICLTASCIQLDSYTASYTTWFVKLLIESVSDTPNIEYSQLRAVFKIRFKTYLRKFLIVAQIVYSSLFQGVLRQQQCE